MGIIFPLGFLTYTVLMYLAYSAVVGGMSDFSGVGSLALRNNSKVYADAMA